ncbi:unnamed protein product, partial [Ectocarpus sp. 13 AM-2016]
LSLLQNTTECNFSSSSNRRRRDHPDPDHQELSSSLPSSRATSPPSMGAIRCRNGGAWILVPTESMLEYEEAGTPLESTVEAEEAVLEDEVLFAPPELLDDPVLCAAGEAPDTPAAAPPPLVAGVPAAADADPAFADAPLV